MAPGAAVCSLDKRHKTQSHSPAPFSGPRSVKCYGLCVRKRCLEWGAAVSRITHFPERPSSVRKVEPFQIRGERGHRDHLGSRVSASEVFPDRLGLGSGNAHPNIGNPHHTN